MSWGYLRPSLRQWPFFILEYPDAAGLGDPTQALEYLRCKQSYQWVAILCHAAKDRNSLESLEAGQRWKNQGVRRVEAREKW